MDNSENFLDETDATVTLTFDNDLVVECSVEAIFTVNERDYMALMPIEEVEGIDPDEIFIYRYTPSDNEEDDEIKLDSIEDDDEYEAVADALEQLIDEYADKVED